MNIHELYRALGRVLERVKDFPRLEDAEVLVPVCEPGHIGRRPAVAVEHVGIGFDWDSGLIFLEPAQPLTALTPEQMADITKSVRMGQSWHAYQAYKRYTAEREELLAALEHLRKAFVVAVGETSPFAKVALAPADDAIAKVKGGAL